MEKRQVIMIIANDKNMFFNFWLTGNIVQSQDNKIV